MSMQASASSSTSRYYGERYSLSRFAAADCCGSSLSAACVCASRYVERLKGVMLGYTHLELLSEMGSIIHDNPRIHVPVSVRFIVFSPKVGDRLGALWWRWECRHDRGLEGWGGAGGLCG